MDVSVHRRGARRAQSARVNRLGSRSLGSPLPSESEYQQQLELPHDAGYHDARLVQLHARPAPGAFRALYRKESADDQ